MVSTGSAKERSSADPPAAHSLGGSSNAVQHFMFVIWHGLVVYQHLALPLAQNEAAYAQ